MSTIINNYIAATVNNIVSESVEFASTVSVSGAVVVPAVTSGEGAVTVSTKKENDWMNGREIKVSLPLTEGLVNLSSQDYEKLLKNTVFAATTDEKYGYVVVKGKKFPMELVQPNFQEVVIDGQTRFVTRITGIASVLNKLVLRRHGLKASALVQDLGQVASSVITNVIAKRQSTGLGYYGAPGQFGNVPDGVLAIDITVATKLAKKLIRRAQKNGVDTMFLPPMTNDMGWLLDGAECVRVKREPATAPNSGDVMPIMVVDAGYPGIGLNEQTMESLLGDFDFDTLMTYLCKSSEIVAVKHMRDAYVEFRSGRKNTVPFRPIHKVNTIAANVTLQSIGASQYFDDAEGAFIRAVGAEDKASIGRFKTSVFWVLGGVYRHSVTKGELLDKALAIATSDDNGNVVKTLHREAVASRLHAYEVNDVARDAAALAYAIWCYEMHPYEEAIMDGFKRSINIDTMKMEPDVKVNVQEFLHGATKSGRLDWEQLEDAGYTTEVLKLAVRSSFVEEMNEGGEMELVYSPLSKLTQLNPVYAALVGNKTNWKEGDPETVLTLLQDDSILESMFEAELPTEVGFRVEEDRVTMGAGKAAIPAMPDYTADGNGGGWDVIPSLSKNQLRSKFTIEYRKNKDGVPTLFVLCPVNGVAKPFDAEPAHIINGVATMWAIPVGNYAINSRENGGTEIRNLSSTLVNGTVSSRVRFCGRMIGALELPQVPVINNEFDLRDDVELKVYPSTANLHLVRYGFMTKVAMIANGPESYGQLAGATKAVRNFINSLVLVSDPRGVEFLSNFATLDIPEGQGRGRGIKRVDFSLHVRRHMLKSLQVLGFDLDATSHATRGREVGVIKEDGLTALHPTVFPMLANHVRISKGFSTKVNNLKFKNSRTENDSVSTVVATFLNLDTFGINPGDDTLRTEDGSKALEAEELPLVEVDEVAYHMFAAEFPEQASKRVIRTSVANAIQAPSYFIPDMDSMLNDGAFKALFAGFVPGLSSPINKKNIQGLPARIAAGFVSTLTHVDEAKFIVETIHDERTMIKKGANNAVLSMAMSQLDTVLVPPTTLEETVSKDRAMASIRNMKKVGPAVEVGQFNDFVGQVEAALIAEGKNADARMFLYGINDNGSLTPIISNGEHIKAIVGHIEVARPKYVAEGSYGDIRKSITVSVHDRLASGHGLEWTNKDRTTFSMLRECMVNALDLAK